MAAPPWLPVGGSYGDDADDAPRRPQETREILPGLRIRMGRGCRAGKDGTAGQEEQLLQAAEVHYLYCIAPCLSGQIKSLMMRTLITHIMPLGKIDDAFDFTHAIKSMAALQPSNNEERLMSVKIKPYDCLSPALMDLIATHTAKAKGVLAA